MAQFELDLLDYCITSNHVHLLAIAVGTEGCVRQVAERIWGRRQVGILGSGGTWALYEAESSCAWLSGLEIACNGSGER